MKRTEVKRFTSKMLGSNTYIIYSGKDCFIIDPCVTPGIIDEFIKEKQLIPAMVLITHAHIDHILYINEIRELYKIQAAVHEDDFHEVNDNDSNGSSLFG
jgi:glyoxylase-like metal-dependent hydrolase (beta-lactamase superfamily II)